MNLFGFKKLKNNSTGKSGERIAEDYLKSKGYRLVERNWRATFGELDLVMIEGNVLVLVEVKTRINNNGAHRRIFDTIDKRKINKVRQLSSCYYSRADLRIKKLVNSYRIDAVGVLINEKDFQIFHSKNAF